jgi:hypothetical protein
MKRLLKNIPFLMLFTASAVSAQKTDVTQLFTAENPVAIEIAFSIREVKKQTNDTIFTKSVMKYKREDGSLDSMKIEIRARGNFRRTNCFFPPLRVRMKKKDTEGTLFAGNKSLKLVVPCQTGKAGSDLIIKEYLAYQLYEPVTPYHFTTRLVDLTLIDQSAKQAKSYTMKAFFIEDDDLVAKRFGGKIYEDPKFHPMRLKDTTSVINDFFHFMISNTDWSSMAQHNIKIMQVNNAEFIPLPYDFDMSGVVNAPYAQVNETLGTASVRERLYRGFCRPEPVFQYVRSVYLNNEQAIMKQITDLQSELNPKELPGIQKYIGEFFTILKSDKSFRDNIYGKCRTN